jgi:hypothetical protein
LHSIEARLPEDGALREIADVARRCVGIEKLQRNRLDDSPHCEAEP